jgi:hypothetical protein
MARPGIPEGFMSMLSRIILLGNDSVVSDIGMKQANVSAYANAGVQASLRLKSKCKISIE